MSQKLVGLHLRAASSCWDGGRYTGREGSVVPQPLSRELLDSRQELYLVRVDTLYSNVNFSGVSISTRSVFILLRRKNETADKCGGFVCVCVSVSLFMFTCLLACDVSLRFANAGMDLRLVCLPLSFRLDHDGLFTWTAG